MIYQQSVQSTTVNSLTSKFNFFVRINQGAELRVHLNIGSQWSVSREIVRIKHSAELSLCRINRSRLYLCQLENSNSIFTYLLWVTTGRINRIELSSLRGTHDGHFRSRVGSSVSCSLNSTLTQADSKIGYQTCWVLWPKEDNASWVSTVTNGSLYLITIANKSFYSFEVCQNPS